MATFEEVLTLLQEGCDAQTIMSRCGLSPSKLRRIVRSRAMAEHVGIQGEVAWAQLRMRLAARSVNLPQRLLEIASSQDAEVSRRACMNLLKQAEALIPERPARPQAKA